MYHDRADCVARTDFVRRAGSFSLVSPAALLRSLLLGAAAAPALLAQGLPNPFAAQVVAFDTNGNLGGGIFQPSNALGSPSGATGVHSLGTGGYLTLGFQTPIVDGPGADFLVGENPFRLGSSSFEAYAEMMFVEVSSDGVHFARFPSRYFGPPVQPGPFGTAQIGTYLGLAGQTPVLATNPSVDAQDVVDAGGDAFDLTDLAAHPAVVANLVDLGFITQVRLVDVESGVAQDSLGMPIFDPSAGSADVDCVTAIHQSGTVTGRGPTVELDVRPDGTATLRFHDPDGWQDLDPASLRAALFGIPVDATAFLASLQLGNVTAYGFELVQTVPLPPGLRFTAAFSLKDRAGLRSGASRVRPQ